MSDTAPDFSAFPDSSILIGQRLVMKRGDEVSDAGRVVKVTTVFTEDGSASLGETDTGATFTIGDYPTPPSFDADEDDER
jgi:hypothetical protein